MTRVFVITASIWLAACGGNGRDSLGRVEDSSREPASNTQQAPETQAVVPEHPPQRAEPTQPGATAMTSVPSAIESGAPTPHRDTPSRYQPPPTTPSARSQADTVRSIDGRTFIDARPQSTGRDRLGDERRRPVGTSGASGPEVTASGRPTDSALLNRVESLLSTDPRLRQVDVTVDDGIVFLRGSVGDPFLRDRAFALAKSIVGSRGVVARFEARD